MTVVASSTRSPDLVRLGVSWSGHRSELVLPAQVPLAELVPAMAAAVEALDPEEVHRGCAFVADDGRVLDPENGLWDQGVIDGETVTLILGLGVADPEDVVHDDLVDAVTEALIVVSPAWGDDDSRASSLVLGGFALAAGALVLGLHHSSGPAAPAAAAALALLLLVAGAGAARRSTVEVAILLLLAAGPYAAVAGLALASADVARSCLLAGGALALTGGAALALARGVTPPDRAARRAPPTAHRADGVASSRLGSPLSAAFVPWVVGGSFAALVGATVLLTSLPTGQVVGVDLVGLVVLGVIVPGVVVPTTQAGHRLALGSVLGVDLVIAASAPTVVTDGGWAGLGLIGICGLLQARRTRAVILDVDAGGNSTLSAVAVGASLAGPALAAVGASLAGPALAAVVALSQPGSLLRLAPSRLFADAGGAVPAWAALTTVVMATSISMAGPLVTYLRTGRRPAISGMLRGGPDLVDVTALAGLVAFLVVAVGLASPVVLT